MASTLGRNLVGEIYALLRASKADEAVAFYERELTSQERALPDLRLAYAIGLMLSGQENKGLRRLSADVLALPNARAELRRYAISPMVQSGQLERAVEILDLVLAANPEAVEDRRLRGSVLGRLRRWAPAIEDARIVVRELPDDLAAQRSLIQSLLQGGSVDEAGAKAAALGLRATQDARLSNIALLALTRSGRMEDATDLVLKMADSEISDEVSASVIVRTLVDAGSDEDAIEIGERLLEEGWEHETIRASLAEAYLRSHRDDRYDRAIQHLKEGLDVNPRDAKLNLAIGEAYLRTRNYEAALVHLKAVCEVQPKAPQPRALYARALKQVGRYAEAAHEFRTLIDLQPSSPRWARYAAGALSQAGRRKEAAELFDQFVAARRAALPRSFEQGLKALWDKVDSVTIPRARLDWAWKLSNEDVDDREDWERRAKWGHLADHYMLDWLECRDDRVHEAMMRLADLGDAERSLAAIDRSKGMILASAHIGPMYAGPLALELLGVRSRWLASTPSVARTSYAGSLISTSEQDDMQVGKSFMMALRKGFSVVIAVDGAINLAAPRIPFEGQEITYSSFAARTAQRLEVPSVFAAPRWEGDRIGFLIERLPDPLPAEGAEVFADRWRDAYMGCLRRYLGGPPENLRLSGGLWRHIR